MPDHDACQLECIPGWNETAEFSSDYCVGSGTVMYMDGFHTAGGTGTGGLCIALYAERLYAYC